MADNFKILYQKQGTQINGQGNGFDDVWNISYQVTSGPSKGTVATISVPDEDHNAAFVSSAIADKISALDDVASL
jgi:hypothetical protein